MVEDEYAEMDTNDFDRILVSIVGDVPASSLIGIPGIYEILSEHYNNEVLDTWEEEQALK